MGTVDDWLYQRVAGIEPAAPGYTKVVIKPYPVGDLKNASAHVDSPLGTVSSSWTRTQDRFTLQVSVPAGATATVFVPAHDRRAVSGPGFAGISGGYAKFIIGSGTYIFRTAG
jgi:alpha-L-rhamnosidase